MLYLKQPRGDSLPGSERRVPVDEGTALRLERSLLCESGAARKGELLALLADDHHVAGWALRTAELQLGRTINRIEDAAGWLCDRLEVELASSLISELGEPSAEIERRLTALAARLASYERRLGGFQQQLEREKLESLKELAYGAGHEINNPLANIAARAQMLLVDETHPERRRKLSAIHRQAMRAHEMIADLMLFARPPKLNLKPCNLREIVAEVVEQLRERADNSSVDLICESPSDSIEVLADATQLGVAIQAVVVNAVEAAGEGGHVRLSVRPSADEKGPGAEITVKDDGPGISDDVRRHMFDPFYSGREAGRGLGFGLSKCWRIVTDHGGQVMVQRPSEGGAEIKLLFPIRRISISHAGTNGGRPGALANASCGN